MTDNEATFVRTRPALHEGKAEAENFVLETTLASRTCGLEVLTSLVTVLRSVVDDDDDILTIGLKESDHSDKQVKQLSIE